ncbi:hypothetical protein NEOLEDRAFT_1131894 [Neolentinus lepideus HHB14362 ss-1]|uniref:BTB domain-containing protein n=1 Tax=Neolentinus lepideus HHB14362 ss-1 TaxID=1314782 RepID=A0A165TL60_9AGAM|nr:hypothetical protein NEOLEDRAFT_1131894 [Neolentinus lepideus HHB14362 ss-1]
MTYRSAWMSEKLTRPDEEPDIHPFNIVSPRTLELPNSFIGPFERMGLKNVSCIDVIFAVSYPSQTQLRLEDSSALSLPITLRQTLETSMHLASFTDTRFFAFSRRHQQLGRIDTPVALFANTSILKTSAYYDALFSVGFSESSLSTLDEKFPANESSHIDFADYGYDSDSDLSDCDETQASEYEDEVPSEVESNSTAVDADASGAQYGVVSTGRLGRTVIVKDAAARTYTALIFYLYTGEIYFRPLNSSPMESTPNSEVRTYPSRSCSPKSMYRLADKL